MNKKIAFIFIPFAFEGNPATQSGPKAIKQTFFTHNQKTFNNLPIEIFEFSLMFNETPADFLERVFISYKEIDSNFDLIFVFGGNHFSVFPIYKYYYLGSNGLIITLDAHRDYYPGNMHNHATFIKFLGKTNTIKHLLIGYRDHDKHNEPSPIDVAYTSVEFQEALSYIKQIYATCSPDSVYLDLDLDVLDEVEFKYVCNPLPHGLVMSDVFNLVRILSEKNIKCFSISEYMPYLDEDRDGARYIFQLVSHILATLVNIK